MEHEHDGSSCLECECRASTVNIWPCMCPKEFRMKDRRTETCGTIEQQPVGHSYGDFAHIGEQTIVRDSNGDGVTSCIQLFEQFEYLLQESVRVSMFIWPVPATPKPPVKSIVDNYNVRKED